MTKIWPEEGSESNLMMSEGDTWERLIVARYPGRRSLFDLLTSPKRLKLMPLNIAAMRLIFTPVSTQVLLADLRWPKGGAFVIIFLALGHSVGHVLLE
jgi:hypothetical protein